MGDCKASTSGSFVGPVEVRQRLQCGGGRGVFACMDIKAGTLLMREAPVWKVPQYRIEGETLHKALARHILTQPSKDERERLLSAISAGPFALYPQRLGDVPRDVLAQCQQQHAQDVEELRSAAQSAGADACGEI